jgi:hypothetical protein
MKNTFIKNALANPTRPGFTLLETFVAITVLLIALVGPLSIAAQSLRIAYYARDQVTAFYLAQEGLEYVRAMRDQNYLGGSSWLSDIDTCVNKSCIIDFPNFTHLVCNTSGADPCPPVYVSNATTLFNEASASGPPSPFTRIVTLLPVAGTSDEMIVKVTVSWISVGINRSFQVTEHLFNWKG